jgi:hypothetical protein
MKGKRERVVGEDRKRKWRGRDRRDRWDGVFWGILILMLMTDLWFEDPLEGCQEMRTASTGARNKCIESRDGSIIISLCKRSGEGNEESNEAWVTKGKMVRTKGK